jgi:hypothetical protein
VGKRRPDADHCANGHDLRVCGLDTRANGKTYCKACRRACVRRHMRSLRERLRMRTLDIYKARPMSAGDG